MHTVRLYFVLFIYTYIITFHIKIAIIWLFLSLLLLYFEKYFSIAVNSNIKYTNCLPEIFYFFSIYFVLECLIFSINNLICSLIGSSRCCIFSMFRQIVVFLTDFSSFFLLTIFVFCWLLGCTSTIK